MTTKSTPLADLDWHTFSRTKAKSKYISIYFAIAVILNKEKSLKSYLSQYYKRLNEAEYDQAYILLSEDRDGIVEYSQDDPNKTNDIFDFVCLPDTPYSRGEYLRRLDITRTRVCELIGPPVSIIYLLLQTEIEKYKRNKNKSSRHIITKPIDGYSLYYIDRNFLKKWKSLSMIKEIGLLDKRIYTLVKERADLEDNRKKSFGMLTYILTKVPAFKHKRHMVKFTRGKNKTICHQCIYDFFVDVFSDEYGHVEKIDRTYPADSTFKKNIKEMHKYFKDKVIHQK